MIPVSEPLTNTPAWQQQLANAFHTARDLLAYLELEALWRPELEQAARDFPVKVTRHFADLMRKRDPNDPLLRQVLPHLSECEAKAGYETDPTGDRAAEVGDGILCKYHGRALVVTTPSCAIHCRYCFRRHYGYPDNGTGELRWRAVADRLRQLPDISEVILSGGDPLALNNSRLASLVNKITTVPHVERLRIHSRLPVVLPERLEDNLVSLLSNNRLACVLVLHVNHPAELSTSLFRALGPLRKAGITLLNQAVLLQGVNDSLETQIELNKKLFEFGILPYYLHILDKVSGAARFEIGEKNIKQLYQEMAACLPGYLLPRLVKERPGAAAKEPVG